MIRINNGSINNVRIQDSSFKKTDEQRPEPLFSLSADQLAQFVIKRVEQVNFYSSTDAEGLTSDGQRVTMYFDRSSMPQFADQSVFKAYLKNTYWIIHQFSGCNQYKLTPDVRGLGGGNTQPQNSKKAEAADRAKYAHQSRLNQALRKAVEDEKDSALVRTLLSQGADMNFNGFSTPRRTLFSLAITDSSPEVVQVFLNAGADRNHIFQPPFSIDPPLPVIEYVCRTYSHDQKSTPKLKMLIQAGARVTPKCLQIAIEYRNKSNLAALLDAGISPNANLGKDAGHCDALKFACQRPVGNDSSYKEEITAIVKLLIERGATPTTDALNANATQGVIGIAKLLLDKSIAANADALYNAAEHGHPDLVELFLQKKAPMTHPKLIDCFNGYRFDNQNTLKICWLLAKAGFNGNMMKDSNNNSLLTKFCSDHPSWDSVRKETLMILLKNGADAKSISSNAYNALPKEIQEIIEASSINDPVLLKIADFLVNKILGTLSNTIYEKVESAQKIDALKSLVKAALMNSGVVVLFSDEKNDEAIVLRQGLINSLARELENVLGKKMYFNPASNFFSTDEINTWVQDALAVWKKSNQLSNLQIRTQQQEKMRQQGLILEQMEQQEKALQEHQQLAQELITQSEKDRLHREKLAEQQQKLAKEQQQRLNDVKNSVDNLARNGVQVRLNQY